MLIDLVRHGETQSAGVLLGRTDAPLSDRGLAQFARQTGALVIDAIVTSPRLRARVPAESLADARRVPLRVDADWAELDFGAWDGRALVDLNAEAATAAALAAIYRSPQAAAPPGGEDWAALQARVARAIDRLFQFGADSRVLVVTHAGPMRAALAAVCGIPFPNLWAFRVDHGTRITLRVGRDAGAALWGEIIEVTQL